MCRKGKKALQKGTNKSLAVYLIIYTKSCTWYENTMRICKNVKNA